MPERGFWRIVEPASHELCHKAKTPDWHANAQRSGEHNNKSR